MMRLSRSFFPTMPRRKLATLSLALLAMALTVGLTLAQRDRYDRGDRRGGRGYDGGSSSIVPEWHKNKDFPDDVFTFARVQYSSYRDSWRRPKCMTDYPDSDLNFSYRLQELTSLQVDPKGVIVQLTDPQLFDYPFLYMVEPGDMVLSAAEVKSLRRYLLRGGFLMVDDFWGEREYENFHREIKRVFPNRDPIELPLEHEIFHLVYDLKEKPQIPSIHHFWSGRRTERWDASEAHYRAIFDDQERIMVIICHNTDLGDGWEREGLDQGYFHEYSEKYAYPLGINIVTYAMTH